MNCDKDTDISMDSKIDKNKVVNQIDLDSELDHGNSNIDSGQ